MSEGGEGALAGGVVMMGVRVHPWTMRQTLAAIERRLEEGRFTQQASLNVAKLVEARRDPRLARALGGCEIVSVDGMGILWGARVLGIAVPERVAGIDLFGELIALAARRGHRVFLLGAREAVLARAVERLRAEHPGLVVAGSHHGYFPEGAEPGIVERIAASRADLLFVALGSPDKELFVGRWRERLGVRYVMGVGGSFDVLAGRTARAPRWSQRAGLEWAFRLAQEPRRLWRRYLVSNAIFAGLVLAHRLGLARSRER